MLKRVVSVATLSLLAGLTALGQIPDGKSSPQPASTLDLTNWQTIDLPALTFKLPKEFKRTDNRCYHYRCDFFQSNGTLLGVSYTGLLFPAPTNRAKPDFRESSLKVDGLVGQVFQYSSDGKFYFNATFPSDEIGRPVANVQIWSNDSSVADLGSFILQTVRFKAKPKGPQRIYLAIECEVRAAPIPERLKFEDLVKKTTTASDDELAREIRSRRILEDITQERLNELKKLGIGKLALTALAEAARELEEQVRVYELFTANYNAREREKLKIALNAGREFLDRWGCDPGWKEQVDFIRPWLPRLENQIGDTWLSESRAN